MTTTTSLVADVTDYLVTQCQNSASLGGASPAVPVFDGPHISQDQLTGPQRMWIGYDPFSAGAPVMEATQDFANLDQGRSIDETGHIVCAAEDTSGDPAMKGHRDGVKTLLGAVALMLRGAPGSGGPGDITMGGLVFWAQLTDFTWYQGQLISGAGAACVFKVSYFARLTT